MSTIVTAGLSLIALLLILRLIRQRGDLIVTDRVSGGAQGNLSDPARYEYKNEKRRGRPGNARTQILKGGPSTRHERHLVNRETQFNRLLSRRYWVVVEGMLLDPESNEILEDCFRPQNGPCSSPPDCEAGVSGFSCDVPCGCPYLLARETGSGCVGGCVGSSRHVDASESWHSENTALQGLPPFDRRVRRSRP